MPLSCGRSSGVRERGDRLPLLAGVVAEPSSGVQLPADVVAAPDRAVTCGSFTCGSLTFESETGSSSPSVAVSTVRATLGLPVGAQKVWAGRSWAALDESTEEWAGHSWSAFWSLMAGA
jgi:hypothetical protein